MWECLQALFLNLQAEGIALTCLLDREQPPYFPILQMRACLEGQLGADKEIDLF
jgi:hypothetical protein